MHVYFFRGCAYAYLRFFDATLNETALRLRTDSADEDNFGWVATAALRTLNKT